MFYRQLVKFEASNTILFLHQQLKMPLTPAFTLNSFTTMSAATRIAL
jgi:hypothetical protein